MDLLKKSLPATLSDFETWPSLGSPARNGVPLRSRKPELQADMNSQAVTTIRLEDSFRYCPRCGEPGPALRAARELSCKECGLRFFFNAAAAAAAFIFFEGHLLLCVRAHDPGQGLLDLPGGFVEFGETVEEGLRREILEELNIEVTGLRYFMSAPNDYAFAGVPYKTADLFFQCEAWSLEGLRPADDAGEIRLIEPRRVDIGQLAFASAQRAFHALLNA